jgi:hypothetical protein
LNTYETSSRKFNDKEGSMDPDAPGIDMETVASFRKAEKMRTKKVRENLIEQCAIAVHRAYCINYYDRKGEEYWTGGDYEKLDEETKEIDRATVHAVLATIERFAVRSMAPDTYTSWEVWRDWVLGEKCALDTTEEEGKEKST